jgi:anti-sigma regulatory factor (Ser/Thr protein kinase)
MVEQGVSLKTQTHPGAQRPEEMLEQEDDSERISVRFEAGPSAAAWARNALLALEDRVGEEQMADIRLLVSELVTNSVRHSDISASDTVELEVSVVSGTIRVEVRDSGTGFAPRPRTPGQSKAGGWGLFLVERLADRWGVICNHVTRVWFEIDCRGAAPA